ncbi:hypothetical protein AB0L05_27995 [Nonomuraea pusilla]|uniref:hypothetical protein n=1 Tax=Nonomuraea pusilla TaxID=46177 RepID=UPI0033267000
MSSENGRVGQFPQREELPGEIAAISIPGEEEDDEPTIIISTREARARNAFRYLRAYILIPLAIGWAGRLRWLAREHRPVLTVVGVVAVGVGAAAATVALMDRTPPIAHKHIVVVTPPPAIAPTVTRSTGSMRWTVPPWRAVHSRTPQPALPSAEPGGDKPMIAVAGHCASHVLACLPPPANVRLLG